MNERRQETRSAQRAEAMASPLRMEIVGLFGQANELSVADIAGRIGRPATSVYHHLHVLLDAEILREAGTRPKGKRHETLYALTEGTVRLEVEPDDAVAIEHAMKAVRAGLRMAERDVAAAVTRDDVVHEGPERTLMTMRVHVRASKRLLAAINEHLLAIEELLQHEAEHAPDESPDDRFLSLTTVLAPLSGRDAKQKDGS